MAIEGVMTLLILATLLTGAAQYIEGGSAKEPANYQGCELLAHSRYCKSDTKNNFRPYSQYIQLPNLMGHKNQLDAGANADMVARFIHGLGMDNISFDTNYRLFVCTVFLPPCMGDGRAVQPCRELCNRARQRAYALEEQGHEWPDDFNCDNFPRQTGGATVTCVPPVGGGVDEEDEVLPVVTPRPLPDEAAGSANCVDITKPFNLNRCTCTCQP